MARKKRILKIAEMLNRITIINTIKTQDLRRLLIPFGKTSRNLWRIDL